MELGLLKEKIKKHRIVFLAAFFGIYMFEYMVTLTFIDQGNIDISTPAWQLTLHYADYLLVVAGFGSFALLRRIIKEERARIRLLVIPNLVYAVSVVGLYFLKSPAGYSAMAMLASFSLGTLGGMVYFCVSMALAQTPYMGRVMAAGACGAVLLQYLLQEYLDIMFGIPLMLALGFSATLWLAVNKPWAWLGEDCLPYQKESRESKRDLRKELCILSLTVVVLSVIGTFYDTQMTRLNVESGYREFNYYAWPRLFVMGGYLLVGLVGDLEKQKYVPVATLCVAMFGVFNPILFGAYEDYTFNMCLYYVCLGANVAYFNLMFWNIAPRTGRPELWAGMGRMVSGVADSILAATPLADLSINLIIGIDILMFVVLVLSLAAGGYLLIGPAREKREEPAPREELSPQQRLKLFAESNTLTPRETEVLEKLLTTEDGIQEIADSLFISRRMVQRYVSSIYDKTKTKTRLGLFQSYINFTGR